MQRSGALCFEKRREVPYTAANLELKRPKNGLRVAQKWPKTGGARGLLSPILALFWAHWAANTLFRDLKNVDSGIQSTVFVSISSPLFLKKWLAVPYTANLELKKAKNAQKTPLFGPLLTPFSRFFWRKGTYTTAGPASGHPVFGHF